MLFHKYTHSIKSFILFSVLSIVTFVMLASALSIYLETRDEIEEIFDARLAQSARVMDQLLNDYLNSRGESKSIEVAQWLLRKPNDPNVWHSYERKLYFQILNSKNEVILKSPRSPSKALGDLSLGFKRITLADDEHTKDRNWRTFTLKSDTPDRWLIAAERDDVRRELTGKIARRSLAPIWVALPLLTILLIYILSKGLLPISHLTKTIAERSPKDFNPFIENYPTKELNPLYQELNRLLASQKITLEREKQFTDAAAHELRTPLSILKIHAENALNAKDENDQRKALEKLLYGIDRSSRLIQQLLVLARIENPHNINMTNVYVDELLRETVADLTPLALRKQQQVELEMNIDKFSLLSNTALLNIVFSNLIDNAIRYTPVGGSIVVKATLRAKQLSITIIDSGVGVDADKLDRLGEAFFRVDSGKGDGTGLGLTIVKRVSELLDMKVTFSNRQPSGLAVTVLMG
jgi:two-component system sensor histidine kinase QseC